MGFWVERHDTPGAFEALEPEWNALWGRLFPSLPAQTWHWNETWWRHFAVDRPSQRDALRLYAVRDDQRALRLLAPMVLSERPARGPLRARVLHPFAFEGEQVAGCAALCEPADARDAWDALLGHLDAQREWDWVELGGIPFGQGAMQALDTRGQVRWVRESSEYFVRLDKSRQAAAAPKSELLRKEGLTASLSVRSTPEETVAALEHAFAHGSGSDRGRAFWLEYAHGAAARGEARVFQLRVGGIVAAQRLGLVLGKQLSLAFAVEHPEFARFALADTLRAETLRWAAAEKVEVIHLGPARDPAWTCDERVDREAVLLSPQRASAWKQSALLSLREGSSRRSRLARRLLDHRGRTSD